MNWINWRKIFFGALCLLAGTYLATIGRLDMIALEMILGLAGIVIVGNVVSKFAENGNNKEVK